MPYPHDRRQSQLSPGRPGGDAAGITTNPARTDAGGITVTAAAPCASAGVVAWASVYTKDRTGVHRPHAVGVVTSGARHTQPGARGTDSHPHQPRARQDNGGTRPGGQRGRRWQ